MAGSANPKKFCSKPFEWLEVHRKASGREAFLCCSGWVKTPGIKMEGKSVKEVWNSPQAQEFRASILDGSFRYCNAEECIYMAQARTPTWAEGGYPYKNADEVTDPRLRHIIENNLTELQDGPLTWNCASDRTCNLSCPTCRNSLVALKGKEIDEEIEFQKQILGEVGADLRLLYLSGDGDPFASVTARKMLQGLTAEEYPNLRVYLHTNAILWTRKNWEALHKIHPQITIAHISIDAASAETYAINRRGGNWDTLMKNLEFISGLRRSGPLRFVTVSFVVQANNYQEMPAFVALAEKLGFDLVQFHSVGNWGTYTDAAFQKVAVQRPWHPEHHRFLQVLRHESLGKPLVGLFSLYPLREKALRIKGGYFAFQWLRLRAAAYRILLRRMPALLKALMSLRGLILNKPRLRFQ